MNSANGRRNSEGPRHGVGATPVRTVFWLIVGATLVRALVGAHAPLLDDEAYYWVWSRHLAWSYLDHPPMIAYLIFVTTRLSDSELGVRLGPLLLGAATTYTLFLLGRELFSARVGIVAATAFQIVPVLAGGAVVASPDAPLFLAWTSVLRFVWHAVHGRPNWWMAAGIALGFGLLSKLHIAFLALGIVIFLALYHRAWFLRTAPYKAAIIAIALFLPVVYWNMTHDWAMARFILYERAAVLRGVPGITDLVVRQLSFTLLLFPAFVYAIYIAWQRRQDERFAYLFWTSVPVIAVALLLGFLGGTARGTWLAPGYLGLVLVVAALWNRVITLLAIVSGAIVLYTFTVPFLPGLRIPASEELYGWKEVTGRVQQDLMLVGRPAVVMADRYEVASLLAYHTRGTVPVVLFSCPNSASVWPQVELFKDASGVTAIDARWTPAVPWEQYFARIEEAAPLTVQFHAQPRTFRIFRLYRFTPKPGCRPSNR